jgi:signal transduction histidine kinase
MPDQGFAGLVSLACHDLRTPLATVNGFAKTLLRAGELPEREERFVEMIDAAAGQMADLLDLLGLAARIEAGRYDPALREADTLELARSADERIAAEGEGARIEADEPALRRALEALATAALRHGPAERVTWSVRGRELALAPVTEAAAPVVTAEERKDLGALVARMLVEHVGGSLELDGETLLVRL